MRLFKVEEPNLIGYIGEIIAKNILERIYPRFYYNIYWKRENQNLFGELLRHLINDPNVTFKESWKIMLKRVRLHGERAEERVFNLLFAPDFIIESKSKNELIAVEVKTTIHEHIKIRGGAKKELKDQIKKYSACKGITKLILLKISLANFPKIKYRIQEITSQTQNNNTNTF